MVNFMDYMISQQPIRIVDLTLDPAKLSIRSLIIHQAGHLPGRTLYRGDAVFQHFAIVFIAGGSGSYQAGDGEKQQIKEGSLFFFRPGVVYHYGPDEDGWWDEYYFTISGSRIAEWQENWPLQDDVVEQPGIDASQQSRINQIFALMESGHPANTDRAAMLLESLLYEWIHQQQPSPATVKSVRIAQLLEDLSATLYEPFDANAFAERHHWSLSTLRRTISEYTGFALHEYLHRLKVAEAKKLLLNTEQSVKEIAAALGYGDVFYFSRLFKKLSGEAPQLFRKNRQSLR
ncbi:MAG: helix-turn-helix domain-containing protein [Candidatus Pristimantibacillus sp.]